MTFEEFFKKKRIDLNSLSAGDPVLFAEFKEHFEHMGEKSFDHTKKYWFNKLRHQYRLPPEIKTEKPHIANPLAEQTITESLSETAPVSSAPKMGFTPKFKAGATSTTAPKKEKETPALQTDKEKTASAEPASAPKVGFTPRFKAGVTKPIASETKEETPASQKSETAAPAPKVGFTPRFKAGVTKPAATEPKEEVPSGEETVTPAPAATSKAGFTPRFKAGVTKSAAQSKVDVRAVPSVEAKQEGTPQSEQPELSTPAPKVGFTPRFKAGITKPATGQKADDTPVEASGDSKKDAARQATSKPAKTTPEEPVSKPAGFTPRFNGKPKDE